MPIYSYACKNCHLLTKKLYPKPLDKIICEECGGDALFQLPSTISSTTYETKDRLRGKKLPKNQDKLLKKRMKEHHDAYEIEKKIDEHGLQEAQKEGWTKKIKRK